MTGKPLLKPVTSVWPIHRKQLLEEVLSGSRHGTVHRVWVTRGHIFVSLNNGARVFTFDVKPVGIGQDYQFGNLGCLDITDIHPGLTEVLYSYRLQCAVLVQQNGQAQLWKFQEGSYQWEKVSEGKLCSDGDSEVVSVCLLDEQVTVCWCERSARHTDTNCSVWRRHLNIGDGFGPPVKVLENCPLSDLFPLSKGVFVTWSLDVSISGLVFWPHANEVNLYAEDKVYTHKNTNSGQCLDFREIIQPHLSKIKPKDDPLVGRLSNTAKNCVVLVNADGGLQCISDKPGIKESGKFKNQLDVRKFRAAPCSFLLHKDCICQVISDTVIFHNYVTGEVTEEKLVETVCPDVGLTQLSLSPGLPTLMTTGGLNTVQVREVGRPPVGDVTCYSTALQNHRLTSGTGNLETAEIVCKSFLHGSAPSRDFAVDGKHFQNPALVITMLDQLQEKVSSPCLTKERLSIIENYSKLSTYKHTRYNESIVPYLNEYMRVEKTCADIFSQKHKRLVKNKDCVEEEVLSLIDPAADISVPVRQAQLELLALRYPETVLITLMEQLDIESQELSEGEMEKWSYVLTPESSVSSGYHGGSFSLYEIISRLLFQQRPDQLVNFVHIAQLIHDKNIGVSAFIRKRHTFQFYERALSCFPRPESSQDVEGAVRAMAQLMLAMQTRSNLIKALQLLIRYEQWDAAVELLRQQADNSPDHREVFYLLLTSVARCGVLGKYCVPVLQQVPRDTSLVAILEMIGSQGRESQPITRPQDLFTRGSADIDMGQVQEIFLSLLADRK